MSLPNERTPSLRGYDRPADRMLQHRQVSSKPILIVEGPDDLLTLRDHLPGVEIFPVDGKANVVEAARALIKSNLDGFLCVTDNDFDHKGDLIDIDQFHYPYDQRDLESMLIRLGVLAQVIEHLGSKEKLAKLGGAEKLVAIIEAEVAPVSNLRKANVNQAWGLAFDQVDLASKVDKETLKLRVSSYCAALVQASSTQLKSIELSRIAAQRFQDELGHRGKDVVAVAGTALRKKAGNQQQAVCVEQVLTAHLRSSCGFALSKSSWLAGLLRRLGLDDSSEVET
jgi:hypothetical protein